MMTLKELKIGMSAVIDEVGGDGALRQHLLDMGLIPGEEIALIKYAPMGDPMQLIIQGYELTLRLEDAEQIIISDVRPTKKENQILPRIKKKEVSHPGIGERSWKHIDNNQEHTVAEKSKVTIALVGNQNCGKTTLFNQLTGSNQHVGNFPGVTVDRKSGAIKGHPEAEVIDLPGIYSLSPYTNEEVVSRRFILEEKPSAIINIVDVTNLERNLYLTLQILELGVPVVLALNMMDELTGNGGAVWINEMEELLQIPVVPISAAKNSGIGELVSHVLHVAKYDEKPGRMDFCEKTDHNGAVHRAVHGVMELTDDHADRAGIPPRFAATKLIEGDALVKEALQLTDNENRMIEIIIKQMEEERGLDPSAAIADMRFTFIRRLCSQTVVHPKESKEHERSRKLDRILTGKYTAIPLFVVIMGLVFYLTFHLIGSFIQGLLEKGIGALTNWMDQLLTQAEVADALHSLIVDAIFTGVGTVVSFVPIIVVLFFFLSMLEDSGYMARVAFFMDKLLRRLGLSGRSIVPLLIGFGCSVPATMSVRTLPSHRDRRLTTFLIPFMSCSAKMPIYAFFSAAFFPKYAALVMIGLYVLGILIAIAVAFISKNTLFQGEAVPFVMELPNYRLPGLANVLRLMWDKAKDFLQRAFTVIFLGTIVIWLLQNFDFGFHMVQDTEDSMLAILAGVIAPVFRPLGLGDWRIVTAVISGFMAKESIVSTVTVLYGKQLQTAFSACQAAVFLVFCLLYTPCIAAVAAIKREQGGWYALGTVIFQCLIAWLAALLTRCILLL